MDVAGHMGGDLTLDELIPISRHQARVVDSINALSHFDACWQRIDEKSLSRFADTLWLLEKFI